MKFILIFFLMLLLVIFNIYVVGLDLFLILGILGIVYLVDYE